jgi:hypothetical protein
VNTSNSAIHNVNNLWKHYKALASNLSSILPYAKHVHPYSREQCSRAAILRFDFPDKAAMITNSAILVSCPPCSTHVGQGNTNSAKTSWIRFADFLMAVPVDLLFNIPFKILRDFSSNYDPSFTCKWVRYNSWKYHLHQQSLFRTQIKSLVDKTQVWPMPQKYSFVMNIVLICFMPFLVITTTVCTVYTVPTTINIQN